MYRVFLTDYFVDPEIEHSILGSEVEIICLKTEHEEDFPLSIAEADALLVWHAHLTEKTFARLKKCRLIARYGVGVDNIDTYGARRAGISVSHVPDYGTNEVADTTLSFLLMLRRGVEEYMTMNRNHPLGWDYHVIANLQRLRDSTLGIIGLGRIGSAVARRALGFGIKVIFYDPFVSSPPDLDRLVHKITDLNELIRQSDHVSLHVPLNAETVGMVDEKFLAQMKPDSILINTARGKILKNLDLLESALRENRLYGAALDVIPEEPPPEKPALLKAYQNQEDWIRNRLIITPHSAFYSRAAVVEMRTKAAQNVLRVLKGEKPIYVIN